MHRARQIRYPLALGTCRKKYKVQVPIPGLTILPPTIIPIQGRWAQPTTVLLLNVGTQKEPWWWRMLQLLVIAEAGTQSCKQGRVLL